MFAASIMLVTLVQGPMLVNDTRGPYNTKAGCEARIQEMVVSAQALLPQLGIVSIGGKCAKNDDIAV